MIGRREKHMEGDTVSQLSGLLTSRKALNQLLRERRRALDAGSFDPQPEDEEEVGDPPTHSPKADTEIAAHAQ